MVTGADCMHKLDGNWMIFALSADFLEYTLQPAVCPQQPYLIMDSTHYEDTRKDMSAGKMLTVMDENTYFLINFKATYP